MRAGRGALLVTGAAYVVAVVWSALVLPERVPAHFDASGQVDSWSSRTSMVLVWFVVGLVVLVGVPVLVRLAARGDGTWINLPRATKDYWFAPERRDEFRARFQDDLEGFTAMTAVLLIALLALTTWVGVSGRDGAPPWVFAGLVVLYLVATGVWVARLLRSYRPPS